MWQHSTVKRAWNRVQARAGQGASSAGAVRSFEGLMTSPWKVSHVYTFIYMVHIYGLCLSSIMAWDFISVCALMEPCTVRCV